MRKDAIWPVTLTTRPVILRIDNFLDQPLRLKAGAGTTTWFGTRRAPAGISRRSRPRPTASREWPTSAAWSPCTDKALLDLAYRVLPGGSGEFNGGSVIVHIDIPLEGKSEGSTCEVGTKSSSGVLRCDVVPFSVLPDGQVRVTVTVRRLPGPADGSPGVRAFPWYLAIVVSATASLIAGALSVTGPAPSALAAGWNPETVPALAGVSGATGLRTPRISNDVVDGSLGLATSTTPILTWKKVPEGVRQVKFIVEDLTTPKAVVLWSKTASVAAGTASATVDPNVLSQGRAYRWMASSTGGAKDTFGPFSLNVDTQRVASSPPTDTY